MSLKTISREEWDRRCKVLDIPELPEDHPFRSDGPSIIFSSTTQKQSAQKATDSIQKDSAKSSATPKKK
jgi:hypothetical protein